MKKRLLIFIIVMSFQNFAMAQNYRTHKVKQGDTVESIAKQYKVTVSDIYTLNPDSQKKLDLNDVLIIPKSATFSEEVPTEIREFTGYETHKVKRKETLYSIAKKYNIEILDIKEHNKQLYSENLKKGDKIRIPRFKTVINKTTPQNTLKKYQVQPKEGKWRIAYKFGLTVPELEAMNPNMPEVLQPGDEVNVPNLESTQEKIAETDYNYYEVLPKEGFFRLKIKLGMTQEALEALNPGLKESGLKEGMILKVPKTVNTGTLGDPVAHSDLTKSLKNLKTKRLALLLPFKLNVIDVDSVPEAKDIINSDRLIAITLDYYSGVKMALDSAKQLGISTHLKVFDTQNLSSEISRIISQHDLSDYDAVIGPIRSNYFDRVASELRSANIPAISPLMKPQNLYENVFQTIPSDDLLEQAMIDYVKNDSIRSNVIVISDHASKALNDKLRLQFPNATQIFSKKNKDGKDVFYIATADVAKALKSGKNYVFLETSNAGLILNVVSSLNSMTNKDKQIILVTTNKNDGFDYEHLSNYHLSNLNFHYPSIYKPFNFDVPNGFIKKYKGEYGIEPNKYAVRGFDLTLDIVLRLASDEDLYKASANGIETGYVENKFRYNKKLFGGYYNESVYILQYTPELTIEEARP